MSVKKNSKGIYYFFVRVPFYDEFGRKYLKSVKKENKNWKLKDAKKAEFDFLANYNPQLKKNITYQNLYDEFLENYKKRAKNSSILELQTSNNKYILPIFSEIKVKDINLAMIEHFQNTLLNSNLKNPTIKKHQIMFFQILRYAIKKGYVTNIHIPSIAKKQEFKKDYNIISKKNFEKLMNSIKDPCWRIVFSTLYFTGMRKGELIALQFNDIDLNNKTITINKGYDFKNNKIITTKTSNSNRKILIPNQLIDEIKDYYDYLKNSPISKKDRFILVFNSESQFTRNKNNIFQKAELDPIKFHDFRHTHASLLISLGFNAFEIANRLGNSVDMINNIYGHLFKDSELLMMEKINNNFN